MINSCMRLLALILLILLVQVGCAPVFHPPSEKQQAAQLRPKVFVTEDGASLPLRQWLPKQEVRAILVALHGFNDYSQFFTEPANYLSAQGIACFAYDQRGFGAGTKRGSWAGTQAYTQDLFSLIGLLKQRYPHKPVYVLGESMGGAVVIAAMSQSPKLPVDGIILSAPAVWARATMPWYQTTLLWTLAHSMPWLTLTGEGVHVMPSDNIEMLRALGRDPWIIKATRVEAIYGLTDLMDVAFNNAPALDTKTLLLYGEKDEIIPKKPTQLFVNQLRGTNKTVAVYEQGYHMLLRDLHAATAWHDIANWINDKQTKLPSGADNRAKQWLLSSDDAQEAALD